MVYAVELILTMGILREFVMSLKVIIYAKQNGAQMATFAATGTRADIDDLKEDNGGPGNEVDFALLHPLSPLPFRIPLDIRSSLSPPSGFQSSRLVDLWL